MVRDCDRDRDEVGADPG